MLWKRTRGLRYTLWDFYIQWGRRQADHHEVMCSYWRKPRLLRLNKGTSLLGISSHSVLHFWVLTENQPCANARKIQPRFHPVLASVEAWGPSVKSFWALKFEETHPYMAVEAIPGHKAGGGALEAGTEPQRPAFDQLEDIPLCSPLSVTHSGWLGVKVAL